MASVESADLLFEAEKWKAAITAYTKLVRADEFDSMEENANNVLTIYTDLGDAHYGRSRVYRALVIPSLERGIIV